MRLIYEARLPASKAIEYFHIEPALQFRVVATKLEKVKERA
jgi:hypothetical protein